MHGQISYNPCMVDFYYFHKEMILLNPNYDMILIRKEKHDAVIQMKNMAMRREFPLEKWKNDCLRNLFVVINHIS